ncbi:hypothetical protein M1408_01710 [Candidatus Marsarchaeota archaeon]|jgi:hypothetical protein|nr:hypothetical protein [Candidatus Marsarchaeota archaeon]
MILRVYCGSMDQTAFVRKREESHSESVRTIEEDIMGYFGFLRRSKKLYLKNAEKYKDLRRHFECMDGNEAFEYARNAMLFPEKIDKIYGVDVNRIFAAMDKSYWHSASGFNIQSMEMLYGADPLIYIILDTEHNRKLAVDVVNLIRSSPRLTIRKG